MFPVTTAHRVSRFSVAGDILTCLRLPRYKIYTPLTHEVRCGVHMQLTGSSLSDVVSFTVVITQKHRSFCRRFHFVSLLSGGTTNLYLKLVWSVNTSVLYQQLSADYEQLLVPRSEVRNQQHVLAATSCWRLC